MEKKTYKLPFVNNGEAFELPDPGKTGWFRRLLKIEAEVEQKYRHLYHDENKTAYKRLIALDSNIETMYQVCNDVDPKVTREQIESLIDNDPQAISDFIFALYRVDKKDFPMAEPPAPVKNKKTRK